MKSIFIVIIILFTSFNAQSREDNRFTFVDSLTFENISCLKVQSQLQELICLGNLKQTNIDLKKYNEELESILKKSSAPTSDQLFQTEQKKWKQYRNALCDFEANPHTYWEVNFAACVARMNEERIHYIKNTILFWKSQQ